MQNKTVLTAVIGAIAMLLGLQMDVPNLVESIAVIWAAATAIFLRLGIKKAEKAADPTVK